VKDLDVKYPFLLDRRVDEDGDVTWVATVIDLPGLVVACVTIEEVLENLPSAIEDWIEANLFWGNRIPAPSSTEHIRSVFWELPSKATRKETSAAARPAIYIPAPSAMSRDTPQEPVVSDAVRGWAGTKVERK